MTTVNFKFNQDFLSELRSMQALLGTTDLKSTANLLLGLGVVVVKSAAEDGGQIAIVNEETRAWSPIQHQALDNIRTIRAEQKRG